MKRPQQHDLPQSESGRNPLVQQQTSGQTKRALSTQCNILQSKEVSAGTRCHRSEPWKRHSEGQNPGSKDCMLYDSIA